MRKLVTYILRLPPHHMHYDHIAEYVDNTDTDVALLARDISVFGGKRDFRELIGRGNLKDGKKRLKEVEDLRQIRNPIFHAKMMKTHQFQLFTDDKIDVLISWITDVANCMQHHFEYNGIMAMTHHPKMVESRGMYRFPKEFDFQLVSQYMKEYRANYWKKLRITNKVRS